MRPKSASHAIVAGAIIAAGTFSQSAAIVASAASSETCPTIAFQWPGRVMSRTAARPSTRRQAR